MKLAQLQSLMLQAVTSPAEADARLAPLIPPTRDIPPKARLDAYRNNIKGAHLEALDAAYPVIREVLGVRYWRQLLVQEIPAFGSPSPDLHQYGDFLPQLLNQAQRKRKELADFEYLEELAGLEWQIHQAQFAPDDPEFDWAAFQAKTPDAQMQSTFILSRALRVMEFSQPVDAIWHAHQDPPQDLLPQAPVLCCVYRKALHAVTVERISEYARKLLKTLDCGESLQDLRHTDAQILHNWIKRGWIVGFRESPD